MHIAVVGSGYVGLVAGACFADLGHEVILVDNDEQKLAALKAGQVPIHENFLPELLGRHRGSRLEFSGDLLKAVQASEAIFIAVGTPPRSKVRLICLTWNRWPAAFREQSTAIRLSLRRAQFRSTQVTGFARSSCATPRRRIPSMSLLILSSCEKAARSRIFCIPTGL